MSDNHVSQVPTGSLKWLSEQGQLSVTQLEEGHAYAIKHGLIMAEAVVRLGLVEAQVLAEGLSVFLGEELIDLNELALDGLPYALVPLALAKQHLILPISLKEGVLRIALADPSGQPIWQRWAFQYQVRIELVVATVTSLRRLIDEWQGQDTEALNRWASDEEWALPSLDVVDDQVDGPIAQFIQQILVRACQLEASDVHFECYESLHRVRIRVDGQLKQLATLPASAWSALVSRLKVMAQLDITVKRLPQDGRLSWSMAQGLGSGRAQAFRVSTIPTLYGEKVALRLLDTDASQLTLTQLGLMPQQHQQLQQALMQPDGLMLVSGPTGTGKTVTLYACLQALNQQHINIVTVEDPVEIPLAGVNQVAVQPKQGLTFASILRALLRQDPDIMMVGEIRDLETADMAIKAAQTGHKVLSTVHTRDVCDSVVRLRNMGVSAFNVVSAAHVLLAQRLLPQLCVCKQPIRTSFVMRRQLGFSETEARGDWQEYGPKGCSLCLGRGYKGRVGIFELVVLNDVLRESILSEEGTQQLAQRLSTMNVVRLPAAGRHKVMQGQTSLMALLSVLGHDAA